MLVLDDRKDDWWWQEGSETLGPRPELVEEMQAKAGVAFYAYTSERFLAFARAHFSLSTRDESIAEIERVAAEQERDSGAIATRLEAEASTGTGVSAFALQQIMSNPHLVPEPLVLRAERELRSRIGAILVEMERRHAEKVPPMGLGTQLLGERSVHAQICAELRRRGIEPQAGGSETTDNAESG